MIWAIVAAAFAVGLPVAIWRAYMRPLRRLQEPVQQAVLTFSFIGLLSETARIHTRLRTRPTAFTWFAFLMFGATLQIEHVHVHALDVILWVGFGATALLWAAVACFNRPRWAVPPALRGERGLIRLPWQSEELWTLPNDLRPGHVAQPADPDRPSTGAP